MARTISSALQSHLEQETTTLAVCWKLTRKDGAVFGFTDHDEAITHDGVSYQPFTSVEISTLQQAATTDSDNLETLIAFMSAYITKSDMEKGVYDNAELEVFMANYEDPSQGIIKLISGSLGEVELKEYGGKVEFRSITYNLLQVYGRLYLDTCDAQFCDSRCGLTEASYTHSGEVVDVTDRRTFEDTDLSRIKADNYFKYGRVEWLTGNNAGYKMEIKDYVSGEYTLFEPMPDNIQIGDTFNAVAGCDKQFSTCKETFSNLVNFRGFPHIPGRDSVERYPDAQ